MKQKIINLILVFFLVFTMVGCKKENEISNNLEFLDIYYEYYAGLKDKDFVGIDLRDYETKYVEGHLKGFISFDFFPGLVSGDLNNDTYRQRFHEWIQINYSKDTVLFIVDDGDGCTDTVNRVLKSQNFDEYYIYSKGYDKLIQANEGLIEIVTGGSECDC